MAIAELPHAVLHEVSVNEIALDQRQSETEPGQPSHDDPVAFRYGAWANPLGRLKYYLAKWSLDVLRWKDGRTHRTEIGFVKLAVDELFDMDGDPVPMLALYLTNNDTDSTDEAQQPVAIFTRKGIRFCAPILEGGGSAGLTMQIWDGEGRHFCQVQSDGNFVGYRASTPYSIANPEAVLFDWFSIQARLSALEARR